MSPPSRWAEKYDDLSRYNRQPASGLGIKLASGANEMATAERVINRLNELAQFFPTVWNIRSPTRPPPS